MFLVIAKEIDRYCLGREKNNDHACYTVHPNINTHASFCFCFCLVPVDFDAAVQESRNSSALAMELRLSGTNPSILCIPVKITSLATVHDFPSIAWLDRYNESAKNTK